MSVSVKNVWPDRSLAACQELGHLDIPSFLTWVWTSYFPGNAPERAIFIETPDIAKLCVFSRIDADND
jgi:hypothetical protein